MIIDWIENADMYMKLDERIAAGLRALQHLEALDQSPGWHQTPDGLAYLIQEFETADPNHDLWETHRYHTDIQFILSGEEVFGYTYAATLGQRTREYDPVDDIEFFSGSGHFVTLLPGMFAIQFPHDAHLPGCHNGQPAWLKRGVIKLPWPAPEQ
ncbi:MAG: YhcH/YjgK/YiaL family protein [Eubacteriales bacterium]|nr:YhcH/YjgK/YiaL family protein [Eubacteriales bacterium]